jgi:hypothetical protein
MTIARIITIFVILLAVFAGCSKDKVKPSADSMLATEIINAINNIEEAYEGQDTIVLQNHLEAPLAESIINGLVFEKAELTLAARLIKIKDSKIMVNLNWQGTWWTEQGKKAENRGAADFVFHKETIKLISIDGDNPFRTPAVR